MGAPLGNTNATKGKPLTDALRRALARAGDGDLSVGMNKVAQAALDAALAGEQWAIREVWDRMEGKPAQAVTVGNDEAGVFTVDLVKRVIVRTTDSNA